MSVNDSECYVESNPLCRDSRVWFPSDRDHRRTIIPCHENAMKLFGNKKKIKKYILRVRGFRIVRTRYFNLFSTQERLLRNFAPNTPYKTFLSAGSQIWQRYVLPSAVFSRFSRLETRSDVEEFLSRPDQTNDTAFFLSLKHTSENSVE